VKSQIPHNTFKASFSYKSLKGSIPNYLYVKESESEILESLESEILELESDILSLTLQPWVELRS